MKFLNEIDGADKLKQDSNNQMISQTQKNGLHTHSNKVTMDKLSESAGKLLFNGEPVGGGSGAMTWGQLMGQ